MTSNPEDVDEPEEAGATSRRQVLVGALGAGGGLVVGAAGGFVVGRGIDDDTLDPTEDDSQPDAEADTYPGNKPRDAFISHGETPLTIETRRERFGSAFLTATPLMFVRQRTGLPPDDFVDDRDGWTISIDGVAEPRELTVAELRDLGVETRVAVLQCSGNGRAYFEHDPSGSQWTVGAAANVEWTGVPLSAVADALGGVVDGAAFATATGGEPLPDGQPESETIVERSVPLDKALRDAMLAWEANGEPLTLEHGGPLRFVVPGYFGINNVKWVDRLSFSPEETDADVMATSYRVYPVGDEPDPEVHPTMWEMNVKSFVTLPAEDEPVDAGTVRVFGVAFSGEEPIESVEVSVDGGGSWEPAEFYGPDLGPFAWRRFTHSFDASSGSTYTIASRATDAAGEVQPEERDPNERGYLNNSWRDMAIEVSVR